MTKAGSKKSRLLIFIVAYNAEKTIAWVLRRIPEELIDQFEVEVLIIDDKSKDNTFKVSVDHEKQFKFKLNVLFNAINQGYGGNQKIGYHYAIKYDFDFVVLVHGDGQYPPEKIPSLIQPLVSREADAVFGSRMMVSGNAIKGGMPLYKYVGNRVLTIIQNRLLKTSLTEFHSGFRLYSVRALRDIPFDLNSPDFDFDTEIIIQLVLASKKILEMPIPTYYGNEICHVNGLKYALKILLATLKARLQKVNLLYDRKFDCAADTQSYTPKFDFSSPHSLALKMVPKGARVLDVGCASGYLGSALKSQKGCWVYGMDMMPLADGINLDEFVTCDLEQGLPGETPVHINIVLLLDVIEHLSDPEKFLIQLRDHLKYSTDVTIFASTGNVAFFVTRLLHMVGIFNYGKKGILDLTHKRLFTKKTFINIFEQCGYEVIETQPVPGPWQLIFGNTLFGRLITGVNGVLGRLWASMFAYQIFLIIRPRPHLEYLLTSATKQSEDMRKAKAV